MSARPLILEDFGHSSGPVPVETVDGERLEAEKLAAYDKGHAAGWAEATAAAERARADDTDAALARLQDLTFTYHEARAHVLRSLLPLIGAVADRIVPTVLRETLGARLTEMVETLAADASSAEIEIRVAPDAADPLRRALEGRVHFPLVVREDAGLDAGLHHVRLGRIERELDLAGLERGLADALAALDTQSKEMLSNG